MRLTPLRGIAAALVAGFAITGLAGCMTVTSDARVGGGISLDDRASGGYTTPIDVVSGRYDVLLEEYIWGTEPERGVFTVTKVTEEKLTIVFASDDVWNCDYDEREASARCTADADLDTEMPLQVSWSTEDDKRHQILGVGTVTLDGATVEAFRFEGTRIVE